MLRPGFILTLADWVSRRLHEDSRDERAAFSEFDPLDIVGEDGDPRPLEGFFSEWTIFDRKSSAFNGKTGLEYFVEHNPLKLPEGEMAAYRDLLDFRAGFFDIVAIKPGESVMLKDNAGTYEVADVNASMSLKKGETVWCRIALAQGIYQMTSSTILSAPVTFSKNMKAIMARGEKKIVDAREVALWTYGRKSDEKEGSSIDGDQIVSEEEAARALDDAFKAAGMQDMLSSDTVKKWANNESTFPLGFPMKAVFFLLPEDLLEPKRDAVLSALNTYLNNLPRRALKGKTPLEASAVMDTKDRHFEADLFGYGDYGPDLRAAHELMRHDGKQAYEAFEALMKRLLADRVPIITAFRIYANAAVCLLMDSEGASPLGRELMRASLRLNPSYDFGIRQKERLLDPYEDFSDLSKKDARFAKNILNTLDTDGVRRYRRTVFRHYEDFLKKCDISLKCATNTPTSIFNKDGSIVKVGRNDPCPCESGKKFKKCCML